MGKWIFLILLMSVTACSSKKKLESIETEMENQTQINSSSSIGKNSDGDTIIQEKIKLVDYLIDLEKQVYVSEESLFGNKSYGNIGKYGALENCMTELQKKNTGKWGMVELPEKVLLTKLGSPKKKAGVDEKNNLVVLSQEEITGRIKRFEEYKQAYSEQEDWFDTETKNCKLKLKNPEQASSGSKPFPKFEEAE
ncbi:MAG: hypothetical protein RJB66_1125 [Pseudomonadota bacterium]|jgi:hypothetical protein